MSLVFNFCRLRSWMVVLSLCVLTSCSQQSYPAEKIKESLTKICRTEYGIEELDVQIAGETIGVYLPLKKLFAADFKEAVVTGKVRNLETLFEPSPEALEKVEDVLFSISRVLLSTDKPFKFYVLEATDIEKTGLQLVLIGYVDDVKRVRLWDISRNEYRKRVIHELKLNHAVMWHRPVRQFFKDLSDLPVTEVRKKYFQEQVPDTVLETLFLFNRPGHLAPKPGEVDWNVLEMRSAQAKKNEILVYARVKPYGGSYDFSANTEFAYLFVLSLPEEGAQITRIIPFQYLNDTGQLKKIPFPKELQIEENLENWQQEFKLEEVVLGSFLAQQLTRRVQAMASGDERIQNTFREIKLNFDYHPEAGNPGFSLDLETTLRDFNNYSRDSLIFHEDMLYLLNLASREFVDVLRSYQFGDYGYLRLNLAQDPAPRVFGREDLELFRRKKIDFQSLLSLPKV